MHVRFLVPGNIRHSSGGNVYNARFAEGLRHLGVDVEVLAVDGSWPDASAKERRRLGSLLGAWGTEAEITAGVVTILDGLIACGAPAEVEYAAAARHPAWVLLHMPSPTHPDGERRALRSAAGVICTSTWAAEHVGKRHGVPGVRVALPGTDPAPVAAGSQPPHIVAVAALLPNKCQLLAVAALARLQELPWTASLVGTVDADPAYAARVRAAIASHGLEHRIGLTGQLSGNSLEDEWNQADLSLLVSRTEAFGLVVTEALARGIPAIVRDGTGAVEALGMGSAGQNTEAGASEPQRAPATIPGAAIGLAGPEESHPEALASVVRQWLSSQPLRTEWRTAALAARENLPAWDATARSVLAVLAHPPRTG